MLRQTRLKVIDEVANGLSYYDYTFFRELPRLYGAIEDELEALGGKRLEKPIPPFLRIGSWIGGDRDGNPFVTAEVLKEAVRQQSARALAYYLDQLHELGGILSLDSGLVRVSPELNALADQAANSSLTRRSEPYGARSPACIPGSPDGAGPRPCRGAAPADRRPARLRERRGARGRSRRDRDSLKANGGAVIARGRLRALMRAVEVFGFHLAPID